MTYSAFANIDNEIASLLPALSEIGAEPVTANTVRIDGESTPVLFARWRNRLIYLANNVQSGLVCRVSVPGAREAVENDWPSIYSYTVPGFDRFDSKQQVRWIVSVPKGREYPKFLASHLAKLPDAISSEH